jgi:hypothetical protein
MDCSVGGFLSVWQLSEVNVGLGGVSAWHCATVAFGGLFLVVGFARVGLRLVGFVRWIDTGGMAAKVPETVRAL